MARTRELDHQIIVRVPAALYEALQRDAEDNGRTLAQTARFHLTRALANPADDRGA